MRLKNLTSLASIAFLMLGTAMSVTAQKSLPADVVAKSYLTTHEKDLKLVASDYTDFVIDEVDQLNEGGLRHIYIQQRYNGIPIDGATMGLHMGKDQKIGYMVNQFVPNMVAKINSKVPSLAPTAAVTALLAEIGAPAQRQALKVKNAFDDAQMTTIISKKGISLNDVESRLVYKMDKKGTALRLTWEVRLHEVTGKHYWVSYRDAETNSELERKDMVHHCVFGPQPMPEDIAASEQYWKEKAYLDAANAEEKVATAKSNFENAIPMAAPTALSSASVMLANATYSTIALPFENPLETGNATGTTATDGLAKASPYGWLSLNGTAQNARTEGNNVQSYYDPAPVPLGGVPPSGSHAPASDPTPNALKFIYPADFTKEPEATDNAFRNRMSAISNLFYMNNMMHDIFYKHGFTESGRNFQKTNTFVIGTTTSDRGGVPNDEVFAAAQDGGGYNNANMLTLADGTNGQMQMYLWTSGFIDKMVHVVSIGGVPTVPNLSYDATQGSFQSVQDKSLGISSNHVLNKKVVLAKKNANGVGTENEGCGTGAVGGLVSAYGLPYSNQAEVNGNIAMAVRGTCSGEEKTLSAQASGAVGLIITQNQAGAPIPFGGADGQAAGITIPAVMIAKADGDVIRNAIAGGQQVNVDLRRPAGPGLPKRDGDFDNAVIAHEYGHGISTRSSIRTQGGLGTLSGDEQGGEGWSDFWGLYTTLTNADLVTDPAHINGALPSRGIGNYVTYQAVTGRGIRPRPYSIDMVVNEYDYGLLGRAELTAPHGIGFVWCSILYEVLQNFIDKYGMSDNPFLDGVEDGSKGNNKFNRIVVEGIRLQATSPTFLQERDGILAADTLIFGGENACIIWKGFAKRGAGFSASSGTNARGNETPGYDTHPACDPTIVSFKIDKSAPDTILNNTDLTYSIKVTNTGNALAAITLTDEIPANCSFVSASDGGSLINGKVTWSLNTLGNTVDTRTVTYRVNTPTAAKLFFYEDNEGATQKYSVTNTLPGNAWQISAASTYSGLKSYYVLDPETGAANESLTTTVGTALPNRDGLKFYLFHNYGTEKTFDGGVIETATTAAGPWTAFDAYDQNGYTDVIPPANNPLATGPGNTTGKAFGGSSGGYITSIGNLNTLKNSTRFFRFRFSSDAATGATGWFVDNFYVLENATFVGSRVSATAGALTRTDSVSTLVTGTAALPVELLSLNAKANTNNITVTWATATEINNEGFDVLRKTENETAFTKAGFVKGNGNSNTVKNYTFVDNNVENGKTYYYQLNQKDTDGKEKLSNVVSASLEATKKVTMGIQPNPATTFVNIKLQNVTNRNATLKVMGVDGRVMHTQSATNQDNIQLNTSNWAKGVYMVQLQGESTTLVEKLVIQ